MAEFTFHIKRRDAAEIVVEAENETAAEDKVWDWIENDYDRVNDLHWMGEHDVRRVEPVRRPQSIVHPTNPLLDSWE